MTDYLVLVLKLRNLSFEDEKLRYSLVQRNEECLLVNTRIGLSTK